LNSELKKLETHLVGNGSLKSTSGGSYYEVYEKIVELNRVPVYIDQVEFETLYSVNQGDYFSPACLTKGDRIDSLSLVSSKYYRLSMAMDELGSEVNLSPSLVAEKIISILDSTDFNNEFYKSLALLSLAYTSNTGRGIVKVFPRKKEPEYEDFVSFQLLVTSADKIIVNEKEIDEKHLRQMLIAFIAEHNARHTIKFNNEPGTSYSSYVQIQELIISVYSELREKEAQSRFGQAYEGLAEGDKDYIRKLYPHRVDE